MGPPRELFLGVRQFLKLDLTGRINVLSYRDDRRLLLLASAHPRAVRYYRPYDLTAHTEVFYEIFSAAINICRPKAAISTYSRLAGDSTLAHTC